ncbi:DUF2000 domain-containing protein [Luedemannella flava]
MKFTAVLNKKYDVAVLMNALAHLASGLSSLVPAEESAFLDYECPAGGFVSAISQYPYIVLSAKNGNQIRTLRDELAKADIAHNVFVSTMLGASAADQLQATKSADLADLDFMGITFFGASAVTDPLTRKFSLFRTAAETPQP